MSMQDDNIRRLLHYSRMERMNGYLREGRTERYAQARTARHFAILARKSMRPGMDTVAEVSLARLGVRVVWIDDHDDLPDLLGRLYSQAGDWTAVH